MTRSWTAPKGMLSREVTPLSKPKPPTMMGPKVWREEVSGRKSRREKKRTHVDNSGRHIEAERHADKQPALGLDSSLQCLLPLELTRSGTRLVGAEPLDTLKPLLLGEEASGGDVIIEEVVYNRSGDDGEQTDEDEEDAPRGERAIDLTETVGDGGGEHGGDSVRSVPAREVVVSGRVRKK
jgi:hypothetical protein